MAAQPPNQGSFDLVTESVGAMIGELSSGFENLFNGAIAGVKGVASLIESIPGIIATVAGTVDSVFASIEAGIIGLGIIITMGRVWP